MSEIVVSAIIEAGRLRDYLNVFASKAVGMDAPLVSECRIHFDEDGAHVTVVDAANVAMVGPTTLSPDAFESYEAPGRVTVGVGLTRLLDLIDPAASDASVAFEVDMETRMASIQYDQADLNMALIDTESIRTEPDVPDLGLPNTAVLEGRDIDQALTIADMMADHVTMHADPDAGELIFEAVGDTDDGNVRYDAEDAMALDLVSADTSMFSLNYLAALAKPMPPDADVTVRLGDEMPLRFEWSHFDGAFSVVQTLAPRIDSGA